MSLATTFLHHVVDLATLVTARVTSNQCNLTSCKLCYRANAAGTLTQSQTGKWLPARQQSNKLMQPQGWNPRMLDQAGALESPGTDSASSISPEMSGSRRSRRRHKQRSKRAAQLLAESLDSAAEIRSSPEHYSETQLGFQSVHNVLHPDSPEEGAPGFRQGFRESSQDPVGQNRSSAGAEEWSGLKGYLHAAQQGQGGLFAAEALRRMSQDSGGVWMLLHPLSAVYSNCISWAIYGSLSPVFKQPSLHLPLVPSQAAARMLETSSSI